MVEANLKKIIYYGNMIKRTLVMLTDGGKTKEKEGESGK